METTSQTQTHLTTSRRAIARKANTFFENHSIQATAMMVGVIVGVGIFALPFAFAQTGFFIGLGWLAVLGGTQLVLHLIYGEMTLRTERPLHLVGYAQQYFGVWGKWIATVATFFGIGGALLAYLIISGQFLETVISAIVPTAMGTALWWSIAFFTLATVVVYRGVRRVAKGEIIMAALLVALMIGVILEGRPAFALQNLFMGGAASIFLPYGVLFFSLDGLLAIPEMREILTGGDDGRRLRPAIIVGSLVPVALYGLFTLVVVGVTGQTTTPEPFAGLVTALGQRVIMVGFAFGFLAVFSSYIVGALNGAETLAESFRIPQRVAVVVISGVPLILFLAGVRNFVHIVEVVGVVMAAVVGTLVVLLWRRAKVQGNRMPEYIVGHKRLWSIVLITLFIGVLAVRFLL